MSIKQMTKVWELSQHKGTALLLLLAIADNANDDGEAYPGREYLAKKIRMSEQHTRELLAKLIHSHELRLTHRGGAGSGDPHHYKIFLKGRPASPFEKGRQASPKGEVKGRLRGGGPTRNLIEPIEPSTDLQNLPPSTTTSAVGVGNDEWDLSRLLKLGRATKSRMSEIAAMDPAPSASAYVAHYLYGITIHKINSPAHFAAKRIVEQLEAGEPFEALAGQGPRWLTECLHWVFTGGVETFDGLTPQALALKNYLSKDVAARLIPRAFDELGLAGYLPAPEAPEQVGEFIPQERPVLDEWQQALELLRPHYPTATMFKLTMCKLVGRENGNMVIAAPYVDMLKWFEVQKMANGLKDFGVSVSFRLRESDAAS